MIYKWFYLQSLCRDDEAPNFEITFLLGGVPPLALKSVTCSFAGRWAPTWWRHNAWTKGALGGGRSTMLSLPPSSLLDGSLTWGLGAGRARLDMAWCTHPRVAKVSEDPASSDCNWPEPRPLLDWERQWGSTWTSSCTCWIFSSKSDSTVTPRFKGKPRTVLNVC